MGIWYNILVPVIVLQFLALLAPEATGHVHARAGDLQHPMDRMVCRVSNCPRTEGGEHGVSNYLLSQAVPPKGS